MPKVLNKKNGMPEGSVYIGRPSKWGNPFVIGLHGTREEVIDKYTLYLLTNNPPNHLLSQIEELRGKDLVCWCWPKACHGDVLLGLANDKRK